MSIKFVTDYPALFIPEKRMLVIADVQIGLEHELYKKGIFIQPQVDKFLKILDHLIKITKVKNLVILGDLKHKVPGISLRETKQLPRFFEHLMKKVKIIFVKGNHDTDLEGLIPKEVETYGSHGVRIGEYGFFHGHGWPSKDLVGCDYLFMGHLQPGIEFRDDFGYRNIEQVWVKGRLDGKLVAKKYKVEKTGELNFVIVPAFNSLLGSAIINRIDKKDYDGILASHKIFNMNNSRIFLLDGTDLGYLKNLKGK